MARLRQLEALRVPEGLCYPEISGLSREAVEKLEEVRPQTLGQASRVPGVTPAALARLAHHLRTRARTGEETK